MSKKLDITSFADLEVSAEDKTYQQFLTEGDYIVGANEELIKQFFEEVDITSFTKKNPAP